MRAVSIMCEQCRAGVELDHLLPADSVQRRYPSPCSKGGWSFTTRIAGPAIDRQVNTACRCGLCAYWDNHGHTRGTLLHYCTLRSADDPWLFCILQNCRTVHSDCYRTQQDVIYYKQSSEINPQIDGKCEHQINCCTCCF